MILPMILPALLLQAAAPQSNGPDIIVTGPARANGQTPATMVIEPAAMFIVACDEDHDGRTSRQETSACVERSFPGGDAASIGYIAYGDWAATWLGDQNALPSPYEVDRDGDNRITLAELQKQFSSLFSRYDKNDDSAVTRAEALTVRAVAADARGPVYGPGRGKGKGKRPVPRGERIPGGQPTEPPPTATPQARSQ